jgi:hypothetical protein
MRESDSSKHGQGGRRSTRPTQLIFDIAEATVPSRNFQDTKVAAAFTALRPNLQKSATTKAVGAKPYPDGLLAGVERAAARGGKASSGRSRRTALIRHISQQARIQRH